MKTKISIIILLLGLFIGSTSAGITSTPTDVEMKTGESTTLVWEVDVTGISYSITMDDGKSTIIVSTGVTRNNSIMLDVQNLKVGTYNFTLEVGAEWDSVTVTVKAQELPTLENTPVQVFPILALLGSITILRRRVNH